MVRVGEYFKVDIKVGIKMDYRWTQEEVILDRNGWGWFQLKFKVNT